MRNRRSFSLPIRPHFTAILLLAAVVAGVWIAMPARVALGEEIVLASEKMSDASANMSRVHDRWNGLAVCNGEKGFAQWDVAPKTAGEYFLHFLIASGQQRPVTLAINGEVADESALSASTGGFYAEHLKWQTLGPYPLSGDKNAIRLDVTAHMPHIRGLVVSSDKTPPKPTIFGPLPRPRPSSPAPKPTFTPPEETPEQMAACREALSQRLGTDEIVFVKRFPYTSNHYYTEYLNSKWTPGGGLFVLSLKDGSTRRLATELEGGVFGRFDVSFDATRVVFGWKRSADEGYRIYEVNVDGAGLRQVVAPPENEAEIIETYRLGYHHGTDDMHPCYLPDGGICFISTRCQLGVLCNTPDAFTVTNLYRVDADGSNLQRLSQGALSEATPSVMPDGRIMYTRWEYVDKGAVSVKCIWAMRPDGSASSEIYGNDIPFPPTMIQPAAIPGAANQYVILGAPHYPQNSLGSVIRLDMSKPIRTTEPMTYMTPYVDVQAEGGWDFRNPDSPEQWIRDRSGSGPLFREPFPIDQAHFLVAHKPGGMGTSYEPNGYGLYLLDETGHVEPFYRDSETSCWQPTPLRPRVRPPVLLSTIDEELAKKNLARCVVTDIYHGMENVERGSIKYIRVLEQLGRPWSARRRWAGDGYDQQHAVVSKDTALALKLQHGVVPVEDDGSAHFLVPAGANIFFQALDENYLAVQSERTFVDYMPGETRSCIGCHETPDAGPSSMAPTIKALAREPSIPGPQIGETTGQRPLHYPTDVQPVLDRHCVACHNEERQDGGLDLTGRLTTHFSASYENLIKERRNGRSDRREPGLVPTIGENHPKTGNVVYLPTRSLGSHNSLLIAMLAPDKVALPGDDPARMERLDRLVEAHKDVQLKPEELLKISNWVDTNAQYYGSYYGRRHIQHADHPNFRPVPTWESARGVPPLPEECR